MAWSYNAETRTHSCGEYSLEFEGAHSWGLYWRGSRFGGADSLAEGKAVIESRIRNSR